jgi:Undecaprenyl-phosphate glucose phosphotransferase
MSNISTTVPSRFIGPWRFGVVVARGFWLFALLFDVAIIVSTAVAVGIVYHTLAYDYAGPVGQNFLIGSFVATVYAGLRAHGGRYRSERISLEKDGFKSIAVAWNIAFFCLFTAGFLLKETDVYSRGSTIGLYVVGAAAVMAGRAFVVSALRFSVDRRWFIAKRVFLFGARARVEQFLERYQPDRNGLQVVGIWYLPEHLEDGPSLNSAGVRQNLAAAMEFARDLRIDDVFVVAPWSSRVLIAESTKAFMSLPASIHLTPERHFDGFSDLQISRVGPAACLRLVRPPLSVAEIFAKRLLDIMLSVIGLMILWPLFLVVSGLIYLESGGPVFFLQRRHGFNQAEFRILKFRTMTCLEDGAEVRQVRAGDSRVTRVGRFLRRWNLDELPQLVNVLKGDMSIVGPRPHALAHNADFERRIASYARRHSVKPGITGWAQINGLRGETDTNEKMQARVEHDVYYIENWSVALDLYIIAMTLFSRRVHHNAY